MPGEAGIDESGGGMGQQAQASQRGLAFQSARQVVGQGTDLQCGSQYELTGVQHKWLALGRLHQTGQLVLTLFGVDMRVAGVVEHPEQAVQPYVDAGWLDEGGVEGFDAEAAGVELGANIAIGQQHATSLPISRLGEEAWARH